MPFWVEFLGGLRFSDKREVDLGDREDWREKLGEGRRGMGKCGRDVIYEGSIKNAMLFPICRSKNWLVTHLINTQSRRILCG